MEKPFYSILIVLLCLTACTSSKEEDPVFHFTDEIVLPHTPVRSQGRTQTCWAYAMSSMVESDWMAGKTDSVRLSVMYVVRQKYMRQFEQYYYSQGSDEIRGGGLGHSFLHVMEREGVMPDEVYKGCLPEAKFHDHRKLLKKLKSLAEKAVASRDLDTYRIKAESLLDEFMGELPRRFVFQGTEYTPQSFADSLKIDSERYMELTSFMHHPFNSWFVLEVPDNWEHAPYYNVPLDSMEHYVNKALRNGQTVVWDGDISEKYFNSRMGVAFYPDSVVTQQNRQIAFERFDTTDDHMMHIIGTAYDQTGEFYYLLKNSWGRIGPYKGLLYMSRNYFRAKTVSVVLPRKYVSVSD